MSTTSLTTPTRVQSEQRAPLMEEVVTRDRLLDIFAGWLSRPKLGTMPAKPKSVIKLTFDEHIPDDGTEVVAHLRAAGFEVDVGEPTTKRLLSAEAIQTTADISVYLLSVGSAALMMVLKELVKWAVAKARKFRETGSTKWLKLELNDAAETFITISNRGAFKTETLLDEPHPPKQFPAKKAVKALPPAKKDRAKKGAKSKPSARRR